MRLFIILFSISFAIAIFAVQDTDFTMNGAVLSEKNGDAEIWKKEDGTVISIYADRSEAVLTDGSRIVKFKDGRREVFSPKGKKVVVDESKGYREYDSGNSKTRMDFTGMTPFGEKILSVEKVILKEPKIRLLYLPEISDEILYPEKSEEKVDWEIKDFFDGLYDAARQKHINDAQLKKSYSGKPYDIKVSICKYCKTGYCYGKPKRLVVEISEEGSGIKKFEYDYGKLRVKGKIRDYIKEVADYLAAR